MDYANIYNNLIKRAQLRERPNCYTEQHHIVPRSIGGKDNSHNLVHLTLKEHVFAHLCLYRIHKAEHPNLVFAIYSFFSDANPHRKEFRKTHFMPRWVRRHATKRASAIVREYGYQRTLLFNMKRKINKSDG